MWVCAQVGELLTPDVVDGERIKGKEVNIAVVGEIGSQTNGSKTTP